MDQVGVSGLLGVLPLEERGVIYACYCPLELELLDFLGLSSILEWPYWMLPVLLLLLFFILTFLHLWVSNKMDDKLLSSALINGIYLWLRQ